MNIENIQVIVKDFSWCIPFLQSLSPTEVQSIVENNTSLKNVFNLVPRYYIVGFYTSSNRLCAFGNDLEEIELGQYCLNDHIVLKLVIYRANKLIKLYNEEIINIISFFQNNNYESLINFI